MTNREEKSTPVRSSSNVVEEKASALTMNVPPSLDRREPINLNQKDEERETDLLKMQLTMYMDLYKHHFDFYLKAILVYLALNGVIAGIVFRSDVSFPTKCALAAFVSAVAVLSFIGGLVSMSWARSTEKSIAVISGRLGIEPIPLTAAKRLVLMVQALFTLFFIAGFLIIILARQSG